MNLRKLSNEDGASIVTIFLIEKHLKYQAYLKIQEYPYLLKSAGDDAKYPLI